MQLLNVTNAPIYLPYGKAPLPFGDPLVLTVTIAAPGVATIVGYSPTNGDAITISTTGALPTGLAVGTTYYVVNASGQTAQLSATKGGGAITTTGTQSGVHTAHLISGQVDGTVYPFKPTGTVLVVNQTAGTLVLQGAADTNTTGSYGNPAGPGSYSTIASVPANSMALATINYDWIRVSTAATLALIQN